VSSNSFTSDGAIKISLALHSLSQMQRLQLQDSTISDNAEGLGQALEPLHTLRHLDLCESHNMSLADCCYIFTSFISSKASIETLMLPSNLLSEFPSLFSRLQFLPAIQNSNCNACWCEIIAIAQAARS
jgi:hypothetical protein